MNDLMSMGLHRVWKAYTVSVARVRPGDRVLDLAAGTGDLTRAFARAAGAQGVVVHTDINLAMLKVGRDRLIDEGLALPTTACDAEKLPVFRCKLDVVCVAFGLRNMTHKDQALAEMTVCCAQAVACWCCGILKNRCAAQAGLRLVFVQHLAQGGQFGCRQR